MQETGFAKGQHKIRLPLVLVGVVCILVAGMYLKELISIGISSNLELSHDGSRRSIAFVEKNIKEHGTMRKCSSLDGSGPEFLKFMLASLPRSGNTFTRLLLENMTGILTELSTSGEDRFQDPRTGKYYPKSTDCACNPITGESRVCRPSSGDDLVVIKTHFPNIGPEINESEDCISGVILLIRHPVDQFLARAAVAGGVNTMARVKEMKFFVAQDVYKFPEFLDDWEKFQNFWHAYASVHKVPLLAYRYEDLCQDPQTVMRRVADFIGVPFKNVRSSNGVFDSCFLRNPHIMSKSAGLLTQAEIDLMKTRRLPAMDKFGYRRDVSLSTDFETGI